MNSNESSANSLLKFSRPNSLRTLLDNFPELDNVGSKKNISLSFEKLFKTSFEHNLDVTSSDNSMTQNRGSGNCDESNCDDNGITQPCITCHGNFCSKHSFEHKCDVNNNNNNNRNNNMNISNNNNDININIKDITLPEPNLEEIRIELEPSCPHCKEVLVNPFKGDVNENQLYNEHLANCVVYSKSPDVGLMPNIFTSSQSVTLLNNPPLFNMIRSSDKFIGEQPIEIDIKGNDRDEAAKALTGLSREFNHKRKLKTNTDKPGKKKKQKKVKQTNLKKIQVLDLPSMSTFSTVNDRREQIARYYTQIRNELIQNTYGYDTKSNESEFETWKQTFRINSIQYSDYQKTGKHLNVSRIQAFVAYFLTKYNELKKHPTASKYEYNQTPITFIDPSIALTRVHILNGLTQQVSVVANIMMLSELEIVIWSIFLEKLEPMWLLKSPQQQMKILFFTVYCMKTIYDRAHLTYIPYLSTAFKTFKTEFSDFLKHKNRSQLELNVPTVDLNDRFSMFFYFNF